MNLPPYPKYKPSGVEWLGDVPEHWEVKRLGYMFKFRSGGTPDTNNSAFWDGEIPWVSSKDMKVSHLVDTEDHISHEAVVESATTMVPTGSVLMVTRSGILKHTLPVAVTQRPMAINQDIKGCIPLAGITPEFFLYLITGNQSQLLSLWRQQGATVDSLDFEIVKGAGLCLPSVGEQRAIADFLDDRTGKLDALAEKKRGLIEKLKEKRSALISRTVTKGLPPEAAAPAGLPTHPKLKPSGIDWIGDIPEHWEVKPIKRGVRIVRGKFTHRPRNDPRMYDGEYPFIQTGDVVSVNKFIRRYSQTLSEDGLQVSKMFPSGTLVMTIAANIGDIAILNFAACFPDSIVGLIPSSAVSLTFLFYLGGALRPVLIKSATMNTQLNINNEQIGRIGVAFPPLREQTAIADYLDRETAKIDRMIEKVEAALEKLAEYRTALITAAVTGKIDVRAASAVLAPD